MNLVSALLPILAVLQPAAAPPKVSVGLVAAQASVQPGGQTDLALVIDVEKGWHIYHPIILDTGGATTIRCTGPAGVSFGEPRFPTPELAEDRGLKYLGLSGRVVVLVPLHAAVDLPPGPLPLKAAVHVLACRELCYPIQAEAALTLNVAPEAPAPANQKLFEEARELLPLPLERAKYIEGSRVSISPEKIGLDGTGEIELTIRVKAGHHILDRDPGTPDLIPSRLLIESRDGLRFDEQRWPDPSVRQIEGLGKVRELHGAFKVRAPFTMIDREFPSGPVTLRVLFYYQCCNDAGTCYPPEMAEGIVRFVADTPNPPAGSAAIGATQNPSASDGPPEPRAPVSAQAGGSDWAELLGMIVFAFIGGMILNITPCVFPVISIRVIGFVKQAGAESGRILRLGLVFCLGIMVWFWVFGVLTGLGQVPLQHPWVVIALAAVLFVLALSLFGVYEILLPGAATGRLSEAASREGYPGAFLNGFLATLLGTACTGPFFAGAAAYAATQPRSIALTIFTFAGLGMSAPYIVLCAYPAWLKRLPKPGPWMVTFKQIMGFVLLATVTWLLYILGDQLDARGVVWTVAFLGFLALAAWLIGRIQLNWPPEKRLAAWIAAASVGAFGLWFCFFNRYDIRHGGGQDPRNGSSTAPAPGQSVESVADEVLKRMAQADWSKEIPWQPYAPGLADELCRRGNTVYVDYTATWCLNCLANKYAALEIASTRQQMRDSGVIPIVADYTKQNPAMHADLLRFGFNSVPMNLVYPAGRPEGVVALPVLLTPGIVHDALERAGPSRPKTARVTSNP